MRKLIVILAFAVSNHAGAFAQSMLKVSTADKQVINVALDGRYFNKKGTSVTIGDLPPGDHYVQVYEVVLKRNGRGKETVVYEGKVSTARGMVTMIVYDPESGEVTTQGQDMNAYLADHPIPQNSQPASNGNYNYNGGNNNYDNTPAAPTGTLTDSKTDELKIQTAAKKTDTEKMKYLKDELANEKITTDEVANMMDWFIFESAKLDFVQWAYNIAVDKENFSGLETKFTYKNYQDDFDNFIKGKK